MKAFCLLVGCIAMLVLGSKANADPPQEFLLTWGQLGVGDGEFQWPRGVAVDEAGNVYVSDWLNNRIQKFTSEGVFVQKWFSPNPFGITVDVHGNVYVTNFNSHTVSKYTTDGTPVAVWGSPGPGSADGKFYNPTAVATDVADNVYVADGSNNRIQKFTSDGTFVTKWGTLGSEPGQFNTPYGVGVDRYGYVYVMDHRVQKFHDDGQYIWTLPFNGWTNRAIAVGKHGEFYLAQDFRIAKHFASNGELLAQWGSYGAGAGQFSSPTGAAATAAGDVFVVEGGGSSPQRVQKFGYGELSVGSEQGPLLALEQVRPHPTQGVFTLGFSLTGVGPSTLEMFDLTGRRVLHEDVGRLGAGRHILEVGEQARLPAGVYAVRLTEGRLLINRKIVVVY